MGLAKKRIDIMTAGGMGRAPVLSIATFNCLGKAFPNFPIVALDLPFNPLMSGLLGMDFLSQAGVTIDIPTATIVLKPE